MDVQSEVNPYQSPGNEATKPAHANQDLRETPRIKLAWIGVFLLNLCVPAFFRWLATEKGGRIGMFAATIVLFLVGYWLCMSARNIGRALLVGGVAVGLGQALPVLQMMAGSIGFYLVDALELEGPAPDLNGLTNEVSGFVVTATTGCLLMAAAIVVGLGVRGLVSGRRWN